MMMKIALNSVALQRVLLRRAATAAKLSVAQAATAPRLVHTNAFFTDDCLMDEVETYLGRQDVEMDSAHFVIQGSDSGCERILSLEDMATTRTVAVDNGIPSSARLSSLNQLFRMEESTMIDQEENTKRQENKL
mmetsp:Transcript_33878/g.78157  ORF Transcript_33878/g.78157 Transcript_33878/m.78157 type:complete len:134 (+) Transcript_33878:114-515(+)|eukprot:CAMPEP_0116846124 /NCGR_PEP_ID=MMETSP0418-20121206/13661_1 /TAXON_ID=1158023 /ORGANISM="Astrosyne radiata, Strain 13vi08-1A" /LENGTH=133 /DNA_ID=CAMNT_0004477337 /DNA_START=95 /DNA_END=496 /DNA_ORIENTATION=-